MPSLPGSDGGEVGCLHEVAAEQSRRGEADMLVPLMQLQSAGSQRLEPRRLVTEKWRVWGETRQLRPRPPSRGRGGRREACPNNNPFEYDLARDFS
ncbi:hypothetical protein V491_03237, partial [Pseudogymnoascus sp. VKM F-3775]